MSQRKSGQLAILWSYDDAEGDRWLDGCKRAIKVQGFAWWDVGWRLNFENIPLPTAGFIWSTREQVVKYATRIERGTTRLKQPDKTLAREVEGNWKELQIPFGWNDRLHEYLKNERNVLTLLKLSEISDLNPPLKLSQLTLWDGKPVLKPPQGANRIRLPQTL
jgi:hypothetical protein